MFGFTRSFLGGWYRRPIRRGYSDAETKCEDQLAEDGYGEVSTNCRGIVEKTTMDFVCFEIHRAFARDVFYSLCEAFLCSSHCAEQQVGGFEMAQWRVLADPRVRPSVRPPAPIW